MSATPDPDSSPFREPRTTLVYPLEPREREAVRRILRDSEAREQERVGRLRPTPAAHPGR